MLIVILPEFSLLFAVFKKILTDSVIGHTGHFARGICSG